MYRRISSLTVLWVISIIIINSPAVFFLESTIKQTTDTTVVVHRIVVTIIITPTAISTVGNAKGVVMITHN